MNPTTAAVIVLTTVLMSAVGARAYTDIRVAESAVSSRAAMTVAREARLATACAKGQTGVVLFHNGVSCAK